MRSTDIMFLFSCYIMLVHIYSFASTVVFLRGVFAYHKVFVRARHFKMGTDGKH